MGDATKATEIEERLIDFGVRVIKVAEALPKTQTAKHIAGQLLRSGTHSLRITQKLAAQKAMQTSSKVTHRIERIERKLCVVADDLPPRADEIRFAQRSH